MFNNSLNGKSITKATKSLTVRSPIERVIHGTSVPTKAMEKNKKLSEYLEFKEKFPKAIFGVYFILTSPFIVISIVLFMIIFNKFFLSIC